MVNAWYALHEQLTAMAWVQITVWTDNLCQDYWCNAVRLIDKKVRQCPF